MARRDGKSGTPYGTLEMLILSALRVRPMHGYALARTIEALSERQILVEEGSLYPALRRLLEREAVTTAWEIQPNGREVREYTITPAGRKLHAEEVARWDALVAAINAIIREPDGRLRSRPE
jgi:transcriptional regulator